MCYFIQLICVYNLLIAISQVNGHSFSEAARLTNEIKDLTANEADFHEQYEALQFQIKNHMEQQQAAATQVLS